MKILVTYAVQGEFTELKFPGLTGEEEVQVVEGELAPSLQAQSVWLYHYDEDWRKVERKQDEEADIPTDINHGISIDSWIKDKLK